jgi:hypothetical protein
LGLFCQRQGYFPALGQTSFSGDAARHFLATPGLGLASWLSLKTWINGKRCLAWLAVLSFWRLFPAAE